MKQLEYNKTIYFKVCRIYSALNINNEEEF